jgi:hypothetical protein
LEPLNNSIFFVKSPATADITAGAGFFAAVLPQAEEGLSHQRRINQYQRIEE